MIDELIELISEIIDVPRDKIDGNSGPASLPEWDSLAHLCIIAALEEKYNIKLDMNRIALIKNIIDIENLIKK